MDIHFLGGATTVTGSRFLLRLGGREIPARLSMPARFNVANALCAAGIGLARRLRVTTPDLGIVLLSAMVLLSPVPAFSQSCALCYTQAASAGARMIQALRSGILILIAPPTFMTVVLIFVCYRKRNQTRKPDNSDGSNTDW